MDAALLLCLFAAIAAWLWQPIRYANDLWWHLATGRYIVQHGYIPRVDVFSWTAYGKPWINHEWLFQLVLYAFYKGGADRGVLLWKELTILSALGFQAWRLRRAGLGALGVWAIIGVAFWASRYGWNERADLVTLWFVSWLTLDIARFKAGDRAKTQLWHWPLLFAIWANSHGGFVLGLAIAAAFVVGRCAADRRINGGLAAWSFICLAATLLNPNGWRLHESTVEGLLLLRTADFTEWQRTPWHPLELFWLCAGLFWTAGVVYSLRTRRVAWVAFLVGVLLCWSAVNHVRNVPYFMIGAFPWVGVWTYELLRMERRFARRPRVAMAVALFITLAAAIFSGRRARSGVSSDMFPIGACRFIDQEAIPGRFYNENGFGGYWIWTFGERRPVFVDGRYHMVEGFIPLFREIAQAQAGTPADWGRFLDHYQIDAALMSYPVRSPYPATFRVYFPRRMWALVYWDDVALLFLRRTPNHEALIRQWEFTAVDPDARPEFIEQRAGESDDYHRALERDLRRNLDQHPNSRRTEQLLRLLQTKTASGR
jgi:hypothetical protein